MNDTQFHALADHLFLTVQTYIDTVADQEDKDIDSEVFGNVLEITFENGSKIIINRQEPLHEIWVATRENGFHFAYQNEIWVCNRSGKTFDDVLQHSVKQQSA